MNIFDIQNLRIYKVKWSFIFGMSVKFLDMNSQIRDLTKKIEDLGRVMRRCAYEVKRWNSEREEGIIIDGGNRSIANGNVFIERDIK